MDAQARLKAGKNASLVGICCNLALALCKGILGFLAGSVSMIADAVNNAMDAAANVVTLLGFKLANKPPDRDHPFGHGRMEYLAGLSVAVLVLVAGIELIRESIGRIIAPVPVRHTNLSLFLLALFAIAKLLMARYNYRVARAIDSQALEAAAKDANYDALATTAVLLGALLSRYAHLELDGVLGLGVGAFVLWGGVDLLRDTVSPLLGRMPDPRLVSRIHERILSYPGVLGAHDLMVHDYGPGHLFASAHVEMAAEENPLKTHEIIDQIERDLRADEGLAIILHYDPVVTKRTEGIDPRALIQAAVQAVNADLSIHDLRIQSTKNGLELSFDCMVPVGKEPDENLRHLIEEAVYDVMPYSSCHIAFDTGFVAAVQDEC